MSCHENIEYINNVLRTSKHYINTQNKLQEKNEKFNNKINFRRDKSHNPVRDIIVGDVSLLSRSIIVSLTIATAVVSAIDGAINYIYSWIARE